MSLQLDRVLITMSGDRLRRARRLYGKIASKSIENGECNVHEIAEKLQDRGFYSGNTSIKDIAFSLYRYSHRYSSSGLGWHAWCHEFNHWKAWFK